MITHEKKPCWIDHLGSFTTEMCLYCNGWEDLFMVISMMDEALYHHNTHFILRSNQHDIMQLYFQSIKVSSRVIQTVFKTPVSSWTCVAANPEAVHYYPSLLHSLRFIPSSRIPLESSLFCTAIMLRMRTTCLWREDSWSLFLTRYCVLFALLINALHRALNDKCLFSHLQATFLLFLFRFVCYSISPLALQPAALLAMVICVKFRHNKLIERQKS